MNIDNSPKRYDDLRMKRLRRIYKLQKQSKLIKKESYFMRMLNKLGLSLDIN